jgi:hypothetical protein
MVTGFCVEDVYMSSDQMAFNIVMDPPPGLNNPNTINNELFPDEKSYKAFMVHFDHILQQNPRQQSMGYKISVRFPCRVSNKDSNIKQHIQDFMDNLNEEADCSYFYDMVFETEEHAIQMDKELSITKPTIRKAKTVATLDLSNIPNQPSLPETPPNTTTGNSNIDNQEEKVTDET